MWQITWNRFNGVRFLLLGLTAVLLVPGLSSGQTQEIKKVHALVVIDTNSDLREDILVDKHRMEDFLAQSIPRDRLQLRTLVGSDVTADKVLRYYRDLKTNENEALFFYYAGHGGTDPAKGGHFLYFQQGKSASLVRSRLRQEMEAKKPGLVVIWTDCCSNFVRLPGSAKPTRAPVLPAKELNPIVRSLLFQHRGVVDITAATDAPSWGDSEDGGVFTRTLVRLCSGKLADLDANKDGIVSWKEFFPKLEAETERTFLSYARKHRSRGEMVDSKTQKPHAFQPLPEVLARKPSDGKTSAKEVVAFVSLRNDTDKVLSYHFRWTGEDDWKRDRLEIKETKPYTFPLKEGSGELPKLEVKYGPTSVRTYETRRAEGTPNFEAGKIYSIRLPKTARDLELDTGGDKGKPEVPKKDEKKTPPA